ncbi:MAG: Holliday junction branch migration protein RuvA [bacterium]|nr:Holliday junction branch migration protein RuvA [bacterium]
MISYLKGQIVRESDKYIVLNTGGVGYKIHITPDTVMSLQKIKGLSKADLETSLWIHTAVRENSIDLYGFIESNELEMFELLITISGIGPKTALGIMSSASVEALENAILNEESGNLIKISGIGKKNAEKIVMELKGKVISDAGSMDRAKKEVKDSDVLEALKSLGYSPYESREALKNLPKEISGTNARIKEALKLLARK